MGHAATIRWPAGQGLSAVAVVTAALALAAGSSAIQSGSSIARPLAGAAALKQAQAAGIDIGGVIETVQHHVAPSKRDHSTLVASDRLYRARVQPAGNGALVARVSLWPRDDDRPARRCRSPPLARPLAGKSEQRRAHLAARPGRTRNGFQPQARVAGRARASPERNRRSTHRGAGRGDGRAAAPSPRVALAGRPRPLRPHGRARRQRTRKAASSTAGFRPPPRTRCP